MFKMKSLHVALGGALLLAASALSAQITVKSGEKIAFLGDSITQQGNWESGYINLVMSALEANGIKAVKIPAGISGHKSNQMLARLERDVLEKETADHDFELRRERCVARQARRFSGRLQEEHHGDRGQGAGGGH